MLDKIRLKVVQNLKKLKFSIWICYMDINLGVY